MIDFELSELPATEDQLENCKYYPTKEYHPTKTGKVVILNYEKVDPTRTLAEANRALKASTARPYLGRNCHLCEHSDEAYGATNQKDRVMWCMSCGRRFFKGYDITDYSIWKPPVDVPEETLRDDAEAVMFQAGLQYVASEIKELTSSDIDAHELQDKLALLDEHFQRSAEMYYDPETKQLTWTHPEIKALVKNEFTPAGKVMLAVGCLVSVLLGLGLYTLIFHN